MQEPNKQIHIRLPASTQRELRDVARNNKRSVVKEVEVAIERHVRDARENAAPISWRSGV
jgi:predicted DNA-binding protein